MPSTPLSRHAATTLELASALLLRSLAFGVAWWAVTEGAIGSLVFGVIASVAAALASVALLPPPWPRVRLTALIAFVPYFLVQSVAGGLDVVRRAFSPAVPADPVLVTHAVGHMGKAERIVFTLIVNLIPGTLSTRLEDEHLTLHAIDRALPVAASLATLDARVGALFGRTSREAT
ncbi:Na+/H+ antiporter subunit E [Achromobacter sp. GG226]|uniref:Na+/H+ antiporter subunit E n=1 Tax=Verticiella alkaliphila TaxID=2779529 RepID=UPI001C0B0ECA|nr:Na+/H+ antiporter subunit E [Verticiella sp. GG226]MBU4609833.1 Na+/H+ antiporter subunit E [Verticiella sp. GG226]